MTFQIQIQNHFIATWNIKNIQKQIALYNIIECDIFYTIFSSKTIDNSYSKGGVKPF